MRIGNQDNQDTNYKIIIRLNRKFKISFHNLPRIKKHLGKKNFSNLIDNDLKLQPECDLTILDDFLKHINELY